ncbi:helix-turn-helix domain-containing protein [Cupriavidus pauculus]|jgi:hypothetical protein|uniref:helix-turn-helix domain-containing protein n=1 Tax=Cupriavidus pauculus TaxID=82633 RepID=UPI0030F4B5CC
MTFAQRSVAGEDVARPQKHLNQTDALIAPAPKRLKRKTIEAVERATRIVGIGRSARSALAALARTANNDDPTGKIFKHRETLCAETGMSPATWYRAQRELLDLGLITVDVQVRKRFGRFAGAYIYLTEKATEMLGLSSRKEEETRGTGEDETAQLGEPAVPPPSSMAQPSLKTRVLFTEDRVPYSFQKRQQDRLPQDLTRLRGLGLEVNLIFWLMRKAKEQGHFLSDVVSATWESLAKARVPKAYLLALLTARTDFSAICKAKALKEDKARVQVQDRDFVRSILAGAARQCFVDQKGNHFEVESDGSSVLVTEVRSAVTSRLVGTSLAEFAKRLHAGAYQKAEVYAAPQRASDRLEKRGKEAASTLLALRAMLRDRSSANAANTTTNAHAMA